MSVKCTQHVSLISLADMQGMSAGPCMSAGHRKWGQTVTRGMSTGCIRHFLRTAMYWQCMSIAYLYDVIVITGMLLHAALGLPKSPEPRPYWLPPTAWCKGANCDREIQSRSGSITMENAPCDTLTLDFRRLCYFSSTFLAFMEKLLLSNYLLYQIFSPSHSLRYNEGLLYLKSVFSLL